MKNAFLGKILDVFGFGDGETDRENNQEDVQEDKIHIISKANKSSVVAMSQFNNTNIEIIKLEQFEDVINVTKHLKNKKIVIVNLKDLDTQLAQRCVDFASGAISAVDGEIKEISQKILLLTPNNIAVSTELKNELSIQGFF